MVQFRARPFAFPAVLLDDAVARVTRGDFEPGADSGRHAHGLGYVVLPMTDCRFLVEDRDGSRQVGIAKGAACRRKAGIEHNVVNAGIEPMSFIEIERK